MSGEGTETRVRVESVWEIRCLDLSESIVSKFWWEPKCFRGNLAYFYCDNILIYYIGFKVAAIKKE